MLSPYVREGDRVVDIGPGMGYFTIPLAQLVGQHGRVVAVDVQQQMLDGICRRARSHGVADRITTHVATQYSLGLTARADFVLAFWMVHEVPDKGRFFAEVRGLMKPGATLLVVEPTIEVTRRAFERTVGIAREVGLVQKARPRVFMSRAVVFVRGD
jgi:ubiquinone/menaquinone biosynthesis C-methylase UbiE